jgi:GR25 family glycosyltransferase involved in LPS biosynthesis
MAGKPKGRMPQKALVIHLRRARDRAPQVERLKSSLPMPVEVVDAVDARQSGDGRARHYSAEALARPRFPFPVGDGEIAAFLSHRKAWAMIAAAGADGAFVLEDDVEADPVLFGRAVTLIGRHAGPDDLVRLPWHDRESPLEVLAEDGGTRLFRPRTIGLGMIGQWVGRKAAAQLLAASERFDRPVDGFVQLRWHHRCSVLTVLPSGISEVSERLGGSEIQTGKGIFARIRNEALRPIYRWQIARLSRGDG